MYTVNQFLLEKRLYAQDPMLENAENLDHSQYEFAQSLKNFNWR